MTSTSWCCTQPGSLVAYNGSVREVLDLATCQLCHQIFILVGINRDTEGTVKLKLHPLDTELDFVCCCACGCKDNDECEFADSDNTQHGHA